MLPLVFLELQLLVELIIIEPFNQPPDSFDLSFGQGKKIVQEFFLDGENTFFIHLVEIVVGLILVLSIGSKYLEFCHLLRSLIPHCYWIVDYICLRSVFPCCDRHPDLFNAKLFIVLCGQLRVLQLLDESGNGLCLHFIL